MPAKSELFTAKEWKEAERFFLRVFTWDPVTWKDSKARFIDEFAESWKWARNNELWPARKERLEKAFELLHRKAHRNGWIEWVDSGWQLTTAGLARLLGRGPLTPQEQAPDSHDIDLKAFLRQLRSAFHPSGDHFDVGGEMPREPKELGEGVEHDALFLDLAFHARRMRLPAERDPCVLYKKVKKLKNEAEAKRAQANESLQRLIPKEFARPVNEEAKEEKLNAEKAPPALLALDSVLKAMTTGKGHVDEWMVVPRSESGDIRVAGFTLRGNCGPGDLHSVDEAWSSLLATAKDHSIETYRALKDLQDQIDAVKSQCEEAVDRLARYNHFPCPCEFRAPGHKA